MCSSKSVLLARRYSGTTSCTHNPKFVRLPLQMKSINSNYLLLYLIIRTCTDLSLLHYLIEHLEYLFAPICAFHMQAGS
jgi:hypothetical protein